MHLVPYYCLILLSLLVSVRCKSSISQTDPPKSLIHTSKTSPKDTHIQTHTKRSYHAPLTIPEAHNIYINQLRTRGRDFTYTKTAYENAISDIHLILSDPNNAQGTKDILANQFGTPYAQALLAKLKEPRQVLAHAKLEATTLTALASRERRRALYKTTSMSDLMHDTLTQMDALAVQFTQAIRITDAKAYKLITKLDHFRTGPISVASHLSDAVAV